MSFESGNNQELVFYVRVQFRRNSSMQGTIKWMDGRKTSSFRSVLEMGNLIDSARSITLNSSGAREGARQWKDKSESA